jgi:plastocyanin
LPITLTPERAHARSGVLLGLLALVAGLAVGACEAVGGGATLHLDTAEVQLEPGVRVHDVRVGGSADADSLDPVVLRARPGDIVRFITDDHRTHAVAFELVRLSDPVRDFLDRTNQLRGPPLVNRGAAWVVVLDEAPAGRYPFICRTHDARGMILVDPAD